MPVQFSSRLHEGSLGVSNRLVHVPDGNAQTAANVSGLSHVGGFTCGFAVSFLLLPRVRKSRRRPFWRRAEICVTAAAAVLILLVIFGLLPALLYTVKFHPSGTLEC